MAGATREQCPRARQTNVWMTRKAIGQVTEQQLRLHLPAPRTFVWCVHCLAFHEREWHDQTWQARHEGDRDALAVYTRPPRKRSGTK